MRAMTPEEIGGWLSGTLEDRSLSRNERQVLSALAGKLDLGLDRRAIRRQAFEAALGALADPRDAAVLGWLEGVVRVLDETGKAKGGPSLAEAHFSPGDDCWTAIARLLDDARKTADVCVFTITDDRLAGGLLRAHQRGVRVRIITDDSKAEDLGSDVDRLAGAGIAVWVDRSPFHMHHKFAILDGERLLTGSYNWTRGAANENEENVVVSDDARLVGPFAATFERLWSKLGG